MDGTGVPLVTPFEKSGAIDHEKLREVTSWVTERGVDFVVPCGSNGEAELMTLDERASVVETVADAASVPVLAGTGHPGYVETREATRKAADAGADGALVVTPFYYEHDRDDIIAHYERLASESDLPIYLYSVPKMTGTRLAPETVGTLATHENVHGMKDSAGDLTAFRRTRDRTDEAFDLFVGSGNLYAPALDAGAAGGIMALANVVPDLAAEIARRHRTGDPEGARALNDDLIDLNRAITARFGVSGVKEAMRYRGAPAGYVRTPHSRLGEDASREVRTLVDEALEE